jgi:hypothetical protein
MNEGVDAFVDKGIALPIRASSEIRGLIALRHRPGLRNRRRYPPSALKAGAAEAGRRLIGRAGGPSVLEAHRSPTAHCEGPRCPRRLTEPFARGFQILVQIRQAIVEGCGGVAEKFVNLQPCNAMAALVDGHSLSGAPWSVETNDCRSRNCARADIDLESANPAHRCERQSASVAW